ncbi:hypothetical protein NQ628_13500 [Acinetobacter baumannii]|uniref:hypothetical protein n=1 Tax=Acinetobacter baumannii TaxID=470 RepID=UPI001057DDCD|nr:hypothetical protein [Acinetobacter baumannii]MDC4286704.1 hypothetical protein [Acinetobacter baumannii]MDC4289490.1 hypothetical protein [Acinetobacter baumannii]MDC4445647.1 hypothetical protein [Acinetobacter baumannii]MDC4628840.1 hypothetical protein [Acinetobacter baumannii]MDC4854539.1 hypothetical protein [Acinetobacter baumannii]
MSKKKTTPILKMYWKAYGGFRAFWGSIYFLIPLLITLACTKHWLTNESWTSDPLTILPSLLGFTLAGYAMWLSVGNEKLKILLSSKIDKTKNEYSFFMQINASFIHFVIFQIITLLYVYFLKYNSFPLLLNKIKEYYILFNSTIFLIDVLVGLLNAIGFFLFIYSIFTMLATVLGIFRISFWIDNQNRSMAISEKSIECPDCCSQIPSKAKKCKHCGCNFETVNDPSQPS